MAEGGLGGIAVVVRGLAGHTAREVSEPATKPTPSSLVPWGRGEGRGRPRGILSCMGGLGSRTPLPTHPSASGPRVRALTQPLDDSCPQIMNRKKHRVLAAALQLASSSVPPSCPPTALPPSLGSHLGGAGRTKQGLGALH